MNKYRELAREVVRTLCGFMNLMYKKNASEDFRSELIIRLQELKHKDNVWS